MSLHQSLVPSVRPSFANFSVVLMVNHACNLRCTYCYTGKKFSRPMSRAIGESALLAALNSTANNGNLEIGFFGGEPLLEAERILGWMHFARQEAQSRQVKLSFDLTTNGTISSPNAREILLSDDVRIFVSCDGEAETHDSHRPFLDGRGSLDAVLQTIRFLTAAGKEFGVVSVVRPDNVRALPRNVAFLQQAAVRQINFSLDLWTRWTRSDLDTLQVALAACADHWRNALPDLSINWFDDKLGAFAGLAVTETTARCGFGSGEIAVAPSGNLYPCERLIGEDRADNPMRLFGHVSGARDFLNFSPAPERGHAACSTCDLQSICSTSCRCSNFVRTGDASKPDGLLCALDKICAREVTRVFQTSPLTPQSNTTYAT
jgi:uncharacterized protein